jgi:8-oxo-dGTP pyrophosphatase MutT (NUDIX family)
MFVFAMQLPGKVLDTGFGFVRCSDGHRHWGRFGAAGLLLHVAGDEPVMLLQRRSRLVQHSGTWGLPGGALHRGEAAAAGAVRETEEETDLELDDVVIDADLVDDHGRWSYTTVIGRLSEPVPVGGRGLEVSEHAWVPLGDVAALPLHPGFAGTWPRLLALLQG